MSDFTLIGNTGDTTIIKDGREYAVQFMGGSGPPGGTGAQGPAGDVAKVTTRTALAAIAASAGLTRYLVESGREGVFVFDASNHSALVTADTAQGLYVAPASAPTGASGAWVRKFSGPLNALWFGAKGDYNGTTGTDNGPVISAILSVVVALSGTGVFGTTTYRGGPSVYFPTGWYKSSVPFDATATYKATGDGGLGWGAPTKFTFTAGTSAIRAQAENTSGYNTVDGTNHFAGDNPTFEDIQFLGAYTGANANAAVPGILCKRPVNLLRCTFAYFQGDGLLADSTIGGDSTPDGGQVYSCTFINNGGSGRKMNGGDANTWVFVGCQYVGNAAWGVDDESFLGNADIMPKTNANVLGPYKTTNSNATNVFVGAYSESDQPPSSFNGTTLVIGGTHGAGAPTGAYVHASSGTVASPIFTATTKFVGPRLEAGAASSSILFDNAGTNLLYSMNLAQDTWLPFQMRASQMDFAPSGTIALTISGTGLNIAASHDLKINGTTVIDSARNVSAAALTIGGVTVYPGASEWTPNFTAAGDVYIPAAVAMTIDQGNAKIGTGTLTFAKSTTAAPGTFTGTTLPATLQAGAWLKVTAASVTGFVATHLKRTA